MKKSLIALAALAAVGAASAQSSVTLFGGLDTGISRYSLGSVSKTLMTTSGLYSSRLGFKGVEDLGGGMSASFHLEGTLLNDTGTGNAAGGLVFNRRSTVSLAGNFGELRLGRDYTPTFWNYTVFDPFGTLGAGAGSNITLNASQLATTSARSNNSIGYLFNSANPSGNTGFYGQAMYALSEQASTAVNKNDGSYMGFRAGYAQGPLNVALAYGKEKNLANSDFTNTNVAGSYDLGVANLMAQFNRYNSGLAGTRQNSWLLGAQIPVGAGYIPVSYSAVKRNDAAGSASNQFALGYVHNLSKRTALYATYSRLNNKTGALATFSGGNGSSGGVAAATGAGNGYDFGIKHTF